MAIKRYILSRRKGPAGAAGPPMEQVEAAVTSQTEGQVVGTTPTGRRVVTLSEEDARRIAKENRHLVVEEDEPLKPYRMPGLPPMVLETAGAKLTVRARNAQGDPLADCTVYAVAAEIGYKGETGADGIVRIAIGDSAIARVVVSPRHSYWSSVVNLDGTEEGKVDVVLSPLRAQQAAYWVHRLLGTESAGGRLTGRGVSVAVVDSGLAPDVRTIRAVGGRNMLDGADPQHWNIDEVGHGTHCAGLIAANPMGSDDIRGIAPGVTLSVVKVLPGGFTSDLVEALEWCVLNRIDVANMSLGRPGPSQVLSDALEEAHAHGVTVIAATGNESSHVGFPAAHPTAVAVGAIGRFGSFPGSSGHALKVGRYRDWLGGLFSAGFSNFGPEVNVCAPGVAIPSTVPGGYAAWDGTSMACPLVTGLAALVLEACPWVRTRTAQQPQALRWALSAGAVNTGIPAAIQGLGLPTAPRCISALQQG